MARPLAPEGCGGLCAMPQTTVRVDEIPAGGLEFRFGGGAPDWTGMLREAAGTGGPVSGSARLWVHRRKGRVEVRGHYHATVPAVCGRCEDTCSVDLEGDVHANLLLGSPPDLPGEADLTAAQMDDSYLVGDTVEPLELLREQVLLDLPPRPLCRPDCRGICPTCGADRNHEPCGCDATTADPRLAVLANWMGPKP